MNSVRRQLLLLAALVLLGVLACDHVAYAGSATWNLNPINADWNTAANWTPATVPNDMSDVAAFAVSNTTNITCSETVSLDSIVFDSDASPFTIMTSYETIAFYGLGIVNNSAVVQTFIVPGAGFLYFAESSMVGPGTHFVAQGSDQSGYIIFDNDSSAGQGSYVAEGGDLPYTYGGEIDFRDNAIPGSADFMINGGTVENSYGGTLTDISNAAPEIDGSYVVNGGTANGASGGSVLFSSASPFSVNGHFTVNGGTVDGAYGGYVQFNPGPDAIGHGTFVVNGGKTGAAFGGQITWVARNPANATYVAYGGQEIDAPGGLLRFPDVDHLGGKITAFGGANGGAGGTIHFGSSATRLGSSDRDQAGQGNRPRAIIEVFGNGSFDQSDWIFGSHTVGSIEGDGLVFLGSYPLRIGSDDLSTTFSGVIQDGGLFGGAGGSLVKTGNGTLVLSGANTYSGGTAVLAGRLMLANKRGSATGTGHVRVKGGTLAGSGRVVGPLVVEVGNLAPGSGTDTARLLIQKALTFDAMANFQVDINSTNVTTDQVTSKGVTISDGATIAFADLEAVTLPAGTVLMVIDNTAVTPIIGVFQNLPDGSTLTLGGNMYRVNYEGGTGNDLSLTVQ